MKKFKFRLQSVLEKRQKELEDKQLEMAKVQAHKREQEQVLNSFVQKQEDAKTALDSIIGETGNVDIITIRNHQNYIDRLDGDISLQLKVISDIDQELDLKQEEVRDALKAKTMLEKLKEKQYKKFLEEFEALSANELDDITSARFRLDQREKVN